MNTCENNHTGVNDGMEVAGVIDMFYQSDFTRNLRYKYYLRDADSAAFPTVLKEKPYGDERIPEKLEYVLHVRKRMGTRLQKLKEKMGNTHLRPSYNEKYIVYYFEKNTLFSEVPSAGRIWN